MTILKRGPQNGDFCVFNVIPSSLGTNGHSIVTIACMKAAQHVIRKYQSYFHDYYACSQFFEHVFHKGYLFGGLHGRDFRRGEVARLLHLVAIPTADHRQLPQNS